MLFPVFENPMQLGFRVGRVFARTNMLLLYLTHTNKTKTKTYNSEDSLVVTHPTTNSPACGLSTAERTGSPIFHTLWSYVLLCLSKRYIE